MHVCFTFRVSPDVDIFMVIFHLLFFFGGGLINFEMFLLNFFTLLHLGDSFYWQIFP